MAFIHSFALRAKSGLLGFQADQRDWSPFVVHFTTWAAMGEPREVYKKNCTAADVSDKLQKADDASFETFKKIVTSKILKACQLKGKQNNEPLPIPPCVCLSECALPGLLGHAERYGRFGFAFEKKSVWDAGGRPCLYVDPNHYDRVTEHFRETAPEIFGLYNKYTPASATPDGIARQDFAHEREWRVFRDISLEDVRLACVLVPAQKYVRETMEFLSDSKIDPGFIVPLDTMFMWGV